MTQNFLRLRSKAANHSFSVASDPVVRVRHCCSYLAYVGSFFSNGFLGDALFAWFLAHE